MNSLRLLICGRNPLAVRVALSNYGTPGPWVEGEHGSPCLTPETASLKQFDADVDALIAELVRLKQEARRCFTKRGKT